MHNTRPKAWQGYQNIPSQGLHMPAPVPTNRFVYVKENFKNLSQPVSASKVLVNPHFKMNKVYINPNFNNNSSSASLTSARTSAIHVNPRVENSSCVHKSAFSPAASTIHVNPHVKIKRLDSNSNIKSTFTISTASGNSQMQNLKCASSIQKDNRTLVANTVYVNPNFQKIHVNPKVLKRVSTTLNNILPSKIDNNVVPTSAPILNRTLVSTRTKLIRAPLKLISSESKKKHRNSVFSRYKIVKSSCATTFNKSIKPNKSVNRYKVDRRSQEIHPKNKKKYRYSNRFLSTSDIVKNAVIKQRSDIKRTGLVNINGIMYKNLPTSLRRASISNIKKIPEKIISQSTYKLVRKIGRPVPEKKIVKMKERRNSSVRRCKIIRTPKPKKKTKVSPKKLRKCNIPCQYYGKHGICRGNENGKCFRKHDPDQIALCTKFLQGACINEKCLLSHKVSPEKMPTCKYYLEGSCSKEQCPYLHVKINPKADICLEFLEGFCKKAAECDKRHQLLCPDFEKHGKCLKQRCPYPHGNMVRKYLVNKQKFVKECSVTKNKEIAGQNIAEKIVSKNEISADDVAIIRPRYYADKLETSDSNENKNVEINSEMVGLRLRPKLGELPAFIPFDRT